MAHDSPLSNKEFEDGLIRMPLPPYSVSMKRMCIALCLGLAGLACAPASSVRPVEPTRSAPVGAGSWLFSMALDSDVDVPILEESLLAATERPLPPRDDGSLVLTLSPKGLYARGKPIAAVREINGVLHLLVEKGRHTPQGEIPEAIWEAMASANPAFKRLETKTHRGNRTVYLVADYRTAAASLAAISIAGYFSGYSSPILVGLSPDGLARGMRLQGARPCPGAAPPKAPTEKKRMGMDGYPSTLIATDVTQIGDCKGLERPDWFNRRLDSIGACFTEEAARRGDERGDAGTLTLVMDTQGNLQASSLQSPWAGESPALQQCVHRAISSFRSPVAKGACVLARGFRFEVDSPTILDVHAPSPAVPHYGRTVRWAFASMTPETVLMDVHHDGEMDRCPRTTTGAIGWNVQGADLDRSRMDAVLAGIDFKLDFLGLRVLGSIPLGDMLRLAGKWSTKGTRIGLIIRRF